MNPQSPDRETDAATTPQTDNGVLAAVWRWRIAIILLLFATYLGTIAFSSSTQWDFRALYLIAKAHQQGTNPYDPAAVSSAIGISMPLPFVYLPHAIYLFYPFTWVSLPMAGAIYLLLKTAGIALLVILWLRIFRFREHLGLFLVFLPFALGAGVIADLRAGNISIFEQALIWFGFYLFLRGRTAGFCLAILCAASFKLIPILLLGFLLTTGGRRDIAYAICFGGLFGLLMALNYIVWPELTSSFLQNVRNLNGERGIHNPSTWAFLQDATSWLQSHAQLSLPKLVPLAVYGGMSLFAVVISFKALQRSKVCRVKDAVLWQICLTCLLYAVVVPRFKNYSYILVIAPAFFVLLSGRLPTSLVLGCVLVMSCTQMNFLEFGKVLSPLVHAYMEYYPLLVVWLVWALCCYSMINPSPDTLKSARSSAA